MLRKREELRRVVWLLAVLVTGVLGLAGCATGTTSQVRSSVAPKPTVQQILAAVMINDAAFTFSGLETTGEQTINFSGSARLTNTPARMEMQLTEPYSGAPLTVKFIVDSATSTIYIEFLTSLPGLSTSVWYSGPYSGYLGTIAEAGTQIASCTSFADLASAKLVGSDTVNGIAVWHVHGKDTCGTASTSSTVDVDFRQDNDAPVKAIAVGGGANVTIDFTSVNTGLTIALPSNAQPFP